MSTDKQISKLVAQLEILDQNDQLTEEFLYSKYQLFKSRCSICYLLDKMETMKFKHNINKTVLESLISPTSVDIRNSTIEEFSQFPYFKMQYIKELVSYYLKHYGSTSEIKEQLYSVVELFELTEEEKYEVLRTLKIDNIDSNCDNNKIKELANSLEKLYSEKKLTEQDLISAYDSCTSREKGLLFNELRLRNIEYNINEKILLFQMAPFLVNVGTDIFDAFKDFPTISERFGEYQARLIIDKYGDNEVSHELVFLIINRLNIKEEEKEKLYSSLNIHKYDINAIIDELLAKEKFTKADYELIGYIGLYPDSVDYLMKQLFTTYSDKEYNKEFMIRVWSNFIERETALLESESKIIPDIGYVIDLYDVKEHGAFSDCCNCIFINSLYIKKSMNKNIWILEAFFHEIRHDIQEKSYCNDLSYYNLQMFKDAILAGNCDVSEDDRLSYYSSYHEHDARVMSLEYLRKYLERIDVHSSHMDDFITRRENYESDLSDLLSEKRIIRKDHPRNVLISKSKLSKLVKRKNNPINYRRAFELFYDADWIKANIEKYPVLKLEYNPKTGCKLTPSELFDKIFEGGENASDYECVLYQDVITRGTYYETDDTDVINIIDSCREILKNNKYQKQEERNYIYNYVGACMQKCVYLIYCYEKNYSIDVFKKINELREFVNAEEGHEADILSEFLNLIASSYDPACKTLKISRIYNQFVEISDLMPIPDVINDLKKVYDSKLMLKGKSGLKRFYDLRCRESLACSQYK